jgi:hypothetical protein
VQGEWVQDEADAARKKSVLLPLIIDDLRPDKIPLGHRGRQALCCKWEADGQLAPESRSSILESLRSHIEVFNPLNNAIAQLQKELKTKVKASRYERFEKIGSGRMSVVFKARYRMLRPDDELYRDDAIKVFPLAGILLFPDFLSQLRQSIKEAQKLKYHDHILTIRDAQLGDTIVYMTMDYVQGASLS